MIVKLIHHYRDLVDSWDESPFQNVEEGHIDNDTHMIKNVCIFGTRHSKNGYDYEDPAIDKLAVLTEGAKFFINHPSKSEAKDRDGVRDIRDWAGVYASPKKKVGQDKIFADLKVRPAFWELVRDVALMKPPGVGNSINSRVKIFKDQAGKEHVVDIDILKSIDLVASAATTQNLFESHKNKGEKDVQEIIDQLLAEKEEKGQQDITYQLISDIFEGLLEDKIKEKEKARKISDLQWKTGDVIDEILKDKAKDIKTKKSDISGVLDDLEIMINDILNGKASATENEKEDVMDFTKLSMEELMKERPDLIKVIVDSKKGQEEFETIKKEHGVFKAQVESLAKEVTDLKGKLEAVTKERDALKVKVDEYDAKDKGAKKEALINSKIEELKVPKDAISVIFKTSLMTMEEKEIVDALNDRKEMYLKGHKTVRNAGEEFKIDLNGEKKEVPAEKKEEVKKNLKESIGQ